MIAEAPIEELPDEDEEPMERYHIEVPPPLPGTSSRQALRAENVMLRDIIRQAGIALEADYAQMRLMDLENERLRKRAFEKGKRKSKKTLTSGQAWHMTAAETLDFLARQDWESGMKDVFKEAAPRFKVLKKAILDYHKAIEKVKKVAEREAKKAAATVARAARAHSRVRGTRGARRGGGRGSRGRGAAAMTGAGAEGEDSDSEGLGTSESSGSSSNTDSESEAEIPIPRSRRQRPIRVIQGRNEEHAVGEGAQHEILENTIPQPTERPRPRPHMRNRPVEIQGVEGVPAAAATDTEVLQDQDEPECAISIEVGVALVPSVIEDRLEAEDEGIEVLLMMQRGENEAEAGPTRR